MKKLPEPKSYPVYDPKKNDGFKGLLVLGGIVIVITSAIALTIRQMLK